MCLRRFPGRGDRLNTGKGRPLAQPFNPGFQILTPALSIGFHGPIRGIAYPAREAEFLRGILGKEPKSNALDAATDVEMYGGLGWRVGHYLMIASFPEVSLP